MEDKSNGRQLTKRAMDWRDSSQFFFEHYSGFEFFLPTS